MDLLQNTKLATEIIINTLKIYIYKHADKFQINVFLIAIYYLRNQQTLILFLFIHLFLILFFNLFFLPRFLFNFLLPLRFNLFILSFFHLFHSNFFHCI